MYKWVLLVVGGQAPHDRAPMPQVALDRHETVVLQLGQGALQLLHCGGLGESASLRRRATCTCVSAGSLAGRDVGREAPRYPIELAVDLALELLELDGVGRQLAHDGPNHARDLADARAARGGLAAHANRAIDDSLV